MCLIIMGEMKITSQKNHHLVFDHRSLNESLHVVLPLDMGWLPIFVGPVIGLMLL